MIDPDAPHPEQLPAGVRKYNIRKNIPTHWGDASLLLGTANAASPQEAFDKWLKQQGTPPEADVYRVLEAGVVSRFEFKHDTTGAYTTLPPQ